MLRATRRGFRKPAFAISEAGHQVATLAELGSPGCRFVVGGQRFLVCHEGRPRVTLTGPAGYVATADGEGDRLAWMISSAAGRWEFVRAWDSVWELHSGGQPVGAVERDGATAAHADLPGDVPLPLRVFFFYLALWLWGH
jgi:hypothetical protein